MRRRPSSFASFDTSRFAASSFAARSAIGACVMRMTVLTRTTRALALVFAFCAFGVLAGCHARSASAPSTAPNGGASGALTALPPPREDGRLPATATPLHYRLTLTIDPNQPSFSGVTTVDVTLPEPTSYVVLHARDMTVSRAVARVGAAQVQANASTRLAAGGMVQEELVLSFSSPLPAGPAAIEITYSAPFANDLAGLYRVQEQGRWYAYTQFESTDARRAFPCFDEPGFKTPYDMTITSPGGLSALANMPESGAVATPDGVAHTFATSPPLPSYLVAFAVGDFDLVEGRKEPFPIRVITTKGRGALAGLALDVAAALIDRLGEYFAMPYPYAKLDLVAVPDFAAGAMENPGLVTFRDVLLLLDPERATTSTRRSQAEVIAHEFAHQWFGDLVTMKWWNDIWLNEGFATWAEAKIVDQWKPTFGATLGQIAGLEYVMDTDALKSARAVREPVRSTSEAMEAFDGITYQKGAAVLRMLEGWLGADVFQRGIQRYVHENAWKNASADDLFAALDFVSTQKVDALASGFLDHPGVPQVLTSYKCDGSGVGKLELRQSEWHPLEDADGAPGSGSAADASAANSPSAPNATPGPERGKRTWTLPVCVAIDGQKTKNCFTLGSDPIVRTAGTLGGRSCPLWVYPNADEAGYYRFLVERDKLIALAHAKSLHPAERLGLVANAWAGVRQGALAPSALFAFLPLFDAETNRFVVDQVVDVLRGVDHALVTDDDRPAYRKYVVARLSARKRALGWWPPSGHAEQDDDAALERRSVLWAMGELGYDPATLADAERYATGWLRDRASVSSDTAAVAVPLASMGAGVERLNALRDAARTAPTPEDRVIAIRAMGLFDDPAVLRSALDLALGDEIKLSEWRYLFGSATSHRASRPVLIAWEKENWAKLRAKAPNSVGRGLVDVVGTTCSAVERDELRAFFVGATQGMEGVKRSLDQAVESASLCVALRSHGEADLTRYLKRP